MPDRDSIDEQIQSEAGHNEDLVPEVEIPEMEPSDGDLAEADLDPETITLFWKLVLVFNVALFGVSIGSMFLYFRGDLKIGGGLLAVGLIAGAYGTVRYWLFERGRDEAASKA